MRENDQTKRLSPIASQWGVKRVTTAAATKASYVNKLCVRLTVVRLFQVCYVVQTKRSVLSLAWDEWFSCKGRERKIFCCGLELSSEPQG